MKRFFYATAALMCLTIAVAVGYSIGQQAHAQPGGTIAGVYSESAHQGTFVLFDNGDLYWRNMNEIYDGGQTLFIYGDDLQYVGNFWNGPPVPTDNSTWGGIKSQLNKND